MTPPAPPAPKPLSRAPDSQPPFRTDQQTTSPYTPVPDHAIVTVLNGRVKRARERAGYIWIDLESAPERAQRWVEPLKGLPMGVTPHVSILGVDVIQFALNTSISIDTCRAPAPID